MSDSLGFLFNALITPVELRKVLVSTLTSLRVITDISLSFFTPFTSSEK
jgi:hypothetical protein|nr:MAG TPA: hypothetical protein [Crassvirales sp.]